MKIIAGNSNRELAEKIAEHCFTDLVPAKIDTFAEKKTRKIYVRYVLNFHKVYTMNSRNAQRTIAHSNNDH